MSALQARFEFSADGLAYPSSYNVAPTQPVLVVTNDGGRRTGELMRWGMIPSWAKDPSIGSSMINARAESVADKPSFRTALRKRRCLVIADGFYEWLKVGPSRRPMRIRLKSGEPFAFAGLWDSWKNPEGGVIRSCAIITTNANSLVESIHDRMPVILAKASEAAWLDIKLQDAAPLSELLIPYNAADMEAYEVSMLVNSPANNVPECIAPLP